MSFSERRATLLRLLEIEENIKKIEHSREYLTMKKGLRALENAQAGRGGGLIVVNSPDDLSRTVEMRKNSPDVEECITKYRARMKSNTDRIESLNHEKVRLKRELTATLR